MSNVILSDDDIIEIKRLTEQEGLSSRKIAEIYGVGKSTIGDLLRKETHSEFWKSWEQKPVASGEVESPEVKRKTFTGKKFLFTSAQNNTYVHDKFLASLKVYMEEEGAELYVGTYHYNKNGFQNGKKENLWFDPKIAEYICDEPVVIAEGLVWCGELNILPTAVNPLSGLHNYTANNSAIVPHAKLQLESVPTPKHEPAKLMYTTGTVTQRNYIQMKAGQKAAWHHSYSALVVEVDEDGDWFVRQLNCESETGNFYDLNKYYTPEGVKGTNHNVEAINWGDTHGYKLDPLVAAISWKNPDSILDTLKPKFVFSNDTFDHAVRNHHNISDPYFRFKQFVKREEAVEDEVYSSTKVLEDMIRPFCKVIAVDSNHDGALKKWLKVQDYRQDPVNALFFLKMQYDVYHAMSIGKSLHVFEHACRMLNPKMNEVTFLREDESFKICGDIECGQHGHLGNNGARGSVRAFQIQGTRFNTDHTHACSIKDGVYTGGVSGKLDMGYNVGGSNWSQSHIITYKNGKRTIITLKNSKWRV